MADINNLERQHESIREYVNQILVYIKNNQVENDAHEIAKLINTLSGRLKIHLQAEDQHLYPKLKQSDNREIKQTTERYIKEMGNISQVFEDYKNKYNTKSKIYDDINTFKVETSQVFKVLANRLDQEDNYLYPLIKSTR